MAKLPRGTVTLLFTDIAGSTRMLQDLGRDRYVRALGVHRRLLREAFKRHGGVEVEMQGDSFHFAFIQARDAVAAAAEAQQALAGFDWQHEPIRVRIGIHTGEPVVVDNLFAGIDVHRAARVMSAGHGGQVLLSETTRALVEAELPQELSVVDLGEQWLKDLVRPERLCQLVVDGLPAEFPMLTTVEPGHASVPAGPPPKVEAIEVRAHRLQERKTVSVLVCDLFGLAGPPGGDPEDDQALAAQARRRVRREVEAFGGTVEKTIGDAVVAVFGAPLAHEDDAERAVRAGLRIVEAIVDDMDGGPSFQVTVGVDTGEAVVSHERAEGEDEALVVGAVVGRATRIQAGAPADGVVVGTETYRQTQRVFAYEELEHLHLKGAPEPIALWRATAPRARFGTDLTRSHTVPLVGRELERRLLESAFERAVHDDSVQLVTLVGEPGLGKSRLVAELFEYVDGQPALVRWRQGRCLPYGEGITFWALGEIVKAQAGILESDTAEAAAAKLDAAVPADESDREWLKARLAPLVGVDSGPAVEREEAYSAWRRFLEALASDGPAVIVFEDLHWADEALLAFLEYLADWAEGVPLLILCTARPELYERHPAWAGGKRNATSVNLARLSDDETARLISALLDAAVLPDDVQTLILERAGGNPLYAEEFVRMLGDRQLLVQSGGSLRLREGADVPFPEGIQALIAARLDTLTAERKAMLQDAAVLGKVFWAGAVAAMTGRDVGVVRDAFHELSRMELVRPARLSSMAGEAEYAFWHVLVRDVAYAQVPRAARSQKHRAAAEWIERQAPGRIEDLADVLAHHYMHALELARTAGAHAEAVELEARALRFLVLAGDRSLSLDVAQAGSYYARALDLAPSDHPERQVILMRRLEALRQSGRYVEGLEILDVALQTPGLSDLDVGLFRLEQGWMLSLAGRVEQAIEALEEGLDVTERGRDDVVGQLRLQLARALTIQGEFEPALEHVIESQRIFEEHENLRGLSMCARLEGDVYRKLERRDEAASTLERGLRLAESVGSVEELGGCLINLSLVEHERGALDAAIAYCRRAVAEFERIGHGSGRAQGYANLAQMLADAGAYEEALEYCERSQLVARGIGHALSIADTTDTMAAIALRRGELALAAARAEEAAALYLDIGAAPQAAQSLRIAAEAWEAQGEAGRAGASAERARALASQPEASPR